MPELPSFLQKGWKGTLLALAVGLIAYWIGTKGQTTVEVPGKPPVPKIVTKVTYDTVTVYKPVLDVDTFIATAPDTCGQWLTRLKAEIIALRDSVARLQAQNRPGTLTFADSTYFKAYKLWIWGQFRYPSGEGGVLYHFEKIPYFSKPRFSIGGHIKFFRAPDLELSMRWKNTNHWFNLTAQPSFAKDGTLKTIFGGGWRYEF